MPRMTGLELLATLKADPTLRAIPAVVLTSSNHERDRRQAYELGAAGYFVKPLEFVDAVGTIDSYWTRCANP